MDKLKQLESFVSVATRGSLTAAARAEGVAPAIMSRRMDALEERLGVKLMVRTTRRLSLTHEGSAFLEDCQRVLADIANAEASVSAGGVKASGHLRVTAPAGFGRRHVAPLVPGFQDRHADVTVSLNLSDRVVDLAGEGYDCAVRVGDFPDSSLVGVRLADNRRLCVATPAFLKAHGAPRHPNDLARFDCLTLSSEASQTRGWAFRVDGEVLYLRPDGPLDCTDGQVLQADCIHLAPGDAHLTVQRRDEQAVIRLDRRPSESGCMPSVDPMLASLASAYGGRALAIVLTGMGRDGTAGARQLAEAGSSILVQDEASSAVWGMPGSIARAGLATAVLAPRELAMRVAAAVGPV